jgi:hypothetical protein
MPTAATADYLPGGYIAAAPPRTITAIQNLLLWLLGATGAVVFIEPSAYEFLMILSIAFFAVTGLRMQITLMPLLLLIIFVNIGYSISAIPFYDDKDVRNWIFTSWYLWSTVPFFAMVVMENTEQRLAMLFRGLVAGAVVASLAGILGYLRQDELLTLYGRARGTFKDPNVLGAYLIFPALIVLQRVMNERFWRAARATVLLFVFTLAVLLSFSRAAWGQLAGISAIMLTLLFIAIPSGSKRMRMILLSLLAIFSVALLLAILLQIDSVAEIFKQRASFDQSYDEGRFGRFGRYVLGSQMALDHPFGIGPLQFSTYMPEDTHNSFLNAFMSGGWIAGICYPALVFMGLVQGTRYVFVPSPWQKAYIAVICAYFGIVAESFIIDTDHWRHFFMIQGVMWGLIITTRRHMARTTIAIPALRMQPAAA